MVVGEPVLFYHSSTDPVGIVGTGKILRIRQPDPSAVDRKSDFYDAKSSHDHPIWFCAEIGFDQKFRAPLTLSFLRSQPQLN